MATCAICEKNLGLFTGKVELKDKNIVCTKCWERAGFNTWGDLSYQPQLNDVQSIRELISKKNSNISSILNFEPTLNLCAHAKFNDETRQMVLSNEILVMDWTNLAHQRAPERFTLFSYDQIVGFEILENGNSIASGGIGRAAIGGALFGGVGALVGASTRKYNNVCNELKVKIIVKDYKEPAFYIPLIEGESDKTKQFYKDAIKEAQDIISKLQLITNESTSNDDTNLNSSSFDKFEEIRKYKSLFDDGIISEDEFKAKKAELLGL